MKETASTSWDRVGKWYNESVGEGGHHYHQTLIIPNVLKLFNFPKNQSSFLLDLACGQGVLSRSLPKNISYVGVDAAPSLITSAKQLNKNPLHQFVHADITLPLSLSKSSFSHGSIILALQNINNPLAVFKNAYHYLEPDAPFVIVLNHPCFRIPRQSSWKIDQSNKIQYRRIDRYMSQMEIPIQAHPSKGKNSSQTWSFHYSLSALSHWLKEAGFTIELIDEWCSNKISEGGAAKMENRSREEIPLFMAILARRT